MSSRAQLISDSQSAQSVQLAEGDFSQADVNNFTAAFKVFDVNGDGRINTEEILEVLTTMGNDVSIERKQKIRDTVRAVDLDNSGDLNLNEFMLFMKLMKQYNESEQSQNVQNMAYAQDSFLSNDSTYAYLFQIQTRPASPFSWWRFFLIFPNLCDI